MTNSTTSKKNELITPSTGINNIQGDRYQGRRRTFVWATSSGWLAVGVGVGWLIRTWTITASTGPAAVAAAVIITAMIIATLIQSWVVIYPALLRWRDVRKREAYITDPGRPQSAD